ncbi:HNH endonuclease [Nocardia wallacei]|uniref:HNH endonuclease n=1 Tax=Nocardia wallacei TaxID=480035 RepID=UPI0024540D0F|nr:HNH endonuclease [Nocardia wallacei]
MAKKDVAVRFWTKVAIGAPNECWPWLRSRNDKGYGQFRVRPEPASPRKAPRVAWELANGESIPDGLMVCHVCDNPPCVNPNHLFLGTAKDNSEDCVRKGRTTKGRAGKAGIGRRRVLTADQVEEVCHRISCGESLRSIALTFGVHHTTIMRSAAR